MNQSQKVNDNATAQGESFSNLKESQNKLLSELQTIRNKWNVKTSNAKMISILHHCPCRLRCLHDIANPEYPKNEVDRLYTAKHDVVKYRIIDAITCRFSGKLKLSYEHKINNGRVDILISSNGKRIGIEVKGGRSIDPFQTESYLYELDVLLVVRVPTREVVKISQKDISEELDKNVLLLTKKIQQINTCNLITIEGDCCKGCTARCQNKKPPEYRWIPNATMAGYSEFIKNANIVTEKVIHELELEVGTN